MSSWMVPGYADVRELGRGAVGRTVLARHTSTSAEVAIRYLADELAGDAATRQRYRDLARALADRNAPHLTGLYEYVEADEGVALVREYVTGASLSVLLARDALKPEAALTVLKGGLLGLAAADRPHGAYTPHNVLVDTAGRVKVSDVGLAANAAGPPTGTPADDVAAAAAIFVTTLAGDRAPTPDRVPRRLRALLPVLAAGSVEGALGELDAVAARACGADWERQGRERLSKTVARHAGRNAGRGRADR